ncbi:MAG: hypothetical protein KAR30_07300 [Gammaproteobacteria bacterium]|nr:hypothetical protein [Gammaproteobacteria bacterium]
MTIITSPILSAFQPPEEKIRQYVSKQKPPFAIVPDPERKLYQTYRLETSWMRMMKAMVFKMGDMLKAFSKSLDSGTMEGGMNRLPADFLILPLPCGRNYLHSCRDPDSSEFLPWSRPTSFCSRVAPYYPIFFMIFI